MINAETFFTAEEEERIRQAVVTAEQRTAGEIVPMLVGASARYAEIEIAGMGVGLVAGTLASFVFQDPWASIHSQLLWPLAGAALGSIFCAIPALKRNLISRDRIAEAVHLRSLAAFTAQGLHYTLTQDSRQESKTAALAIDCITRIAPENLVAAVSRKHNRYEFTSEL